MTHINFLGDKMANTTLGKIGSFFARPDTLTATGFLALTFSCAALEHTTPLGAIIAAEKPVLETLVTAVLTRIVEKKILELILFGKETVENKIINTAPVLDKFHGFNSYGVEAVRFAESMKRGGILAGAFLAFDIVKDINVVKPVFEVLADFAPWVMVMSRLLPGSKRWDNVANGTWLIENPRRPDSPSTHFPTPNLN